MTFLRSNACPKYIGDSPPKYFTHVLTAIDRLNLDLTLLPNYRVKTFYEKLTYPSPRRLPTAGAWEKRLHTPLPWASIWSHLYGGLSTNWEADIAWRIAHSVLKTRAYLKNWCRLNVGDRCPRCGKRESFSHALCECTSVPQVWQWAFTLINKFFSITLALLPPTILFKEGLPTGDKRSVALVHVINEIWAARNLATFEDKPQPATATIRKMKHRLRQQIHAAYNYNNTPVFNKTYRTLQGRQNLGLVISLCLVINTVNRNNQYYSRGSRRHIFELYRAAKTSGPSILFLTPLIFL